MNVTRREALRGLGLSTALLGIRASADEAAVEMPNEALLTANPEAYWSALRKNQFLLPENRVFLNTGSLGVVPRPVLEAVTSYLDRAAKLHIDSGYPRWGYETLDDERAALAEFVGCSKDELAITHNATESLSIIAGGMPLDDSAEVLITDQEHPSGRDPWRVREARGDITVREVALPLPPKDSGEILDRVVSAIGPKTRVLSFSGITSPTGLIMPIREICDAARERGVVSVVDGAHMTGQVPYRIDDMRCDYFAGSPHKWLFAPAGSGLLYIRDERQETHLPVIATARWDDRSLKAGRFMRFGTNNRAVIEGMMAGLAFARSVGPERIYRRIHDLARMTYERARELDYLELLTPAHDDMYGSLVTFAIKLSDSKLERLWQLCDQRLIWTTGNPRLRISSHVHTRPEDIDLFFATLAEVA